MAKVLIVDDSSILRRLLRTCLEQDSALEVCGEAENGLIAVERVRDLVPDIVILDLAMPVMNGLEAARQITTIAPNTAMVLFTMHECVGLSHEAKAAGIRGVLSKTAGAEELCTTLKTLLAARETHRPVL